MMNLKCLKMFEKAVEYMLCYAIAFGLGFLTCALCVMFLVYTYGRQAKVRAVQKIRAKHARKDTR